MCKLVIRFSSQQVALDLSSLKLLLCFLVVIETKLFEISSKGEHARIAISFETVNNREEDFKEFLRWVKISVSITSVPNRAYPIIVEAVYNEQKCYRSNNNHSFIFCSCDKVSL